MSIDRAVPVPFPASEPAGGGSGKPGHPPHGGMLAPRLTQSSGVQADNPGVNLPETLPRHC